jgi:hypothetical protein
MLSLSGINPERSFPVLDDQSNPCPQKFNLWTTRREPSHNWRIVETRGEEVEFETGLIIQTQNGGLPILTITAPIHTISISGEPPTVPMSELMDTNANEDINSRSEEEYFKHKSGSPMINPN